MITTKQASPAAEQWREVFEAFFAYYALPVPPVHLTLTARTFFTAVSPFTHDLLELCEPRDAGVPFGTFPFRRWDMVSNHGSTAIWGARACVPTFSPQVVFHSRDPRRYEPDTMEWDCDLYNPDAGLYYAIQHGIHDVALKRSRDPWKMRAGMMRKFKGLDIPLIARSSGGSRIAL